MCGIAGIVHSSPSADLRGGLARMQAALAHRGPDGAGQWLSVDGRVGFSHLRLSIIDLTDAGAQPMRSPAGHVITYNGEIYNYLELRRELGESRFQTSSDTEVILLAYEKWGAACVERLRGMFAFAL